MDIIVRASSTVERKERLSRINRSKYKMFTLSRNAAVIAVLTLFAAFGVQDVAGGNTSGRVCGLNVKYGLPLKDWDYKGFKVKALNFTLDESNWMVRLMNKTNWPVDRTPCDGHMQPVSFRIRGPQNAYATDFLGIANPKCKRPTIYVDDDWLNDLVRQTGNPWIRKTVVAHELGHVRYLHPYGGGASTVWRQEYDADKYAGFAMCKDGATLQQVQQVYPYISATTVEGRDEDINAHPTLKWRLKAVREGWEEAGCSMNGYTEYEK